MLLMFRLQKVRQSKLFFFYSCFSIKKSHIAAVSLPEGEKASSIACFDVSVFVLSSNDGVFKSSIESIIVLNFSVVSELLGQEIVCLSGISSHCLAVNKEGHVFGCGHNVCSQLCLRKRTGSILSFTKISSLRGYKIRAAYAGHWHSLFKTSESKILSCSSSKNGDLLLSSYSFDEVYTPTETTITSGAKFFIAWHRYSTFFIGSGGPSSTPNI